MIMNSTNLKTISKTLESPYIEEWIGKKIEVAVEKVKAFGEIHDALRVIKTNLELTPKHPKWNGAKEAIKAGTVTIDQIKKSYTISPENEKLICN
jgi:FKBP-type peptidyl-prolyl cis-trans isomerase 2